MAGSICSSSSMAPSGSGSTTGPGLCPICSASSEERCRNRFSPSDKRGTTMPTTQQQEGIERPKDQPSPPAGAEVIEGEVTLELPPPEPEATSPAAGQQAPHGEITVDVSPDGQEAPAPRPRRLSSL